MESNKGNTKNGIVKLAMNFDKSDFLLVEFYHLQPGLISA